MKARIKLVCYMCNKPISFTGVLDTADMPEELFKIQKAILKHRDNCKYYDKRRIK